MPFLTRAIPKVSLLGFIWAYVCLSSFLSVLPPSSRKAAADRQLVPTAFTSFRDTCSFPPRRAEGNIQVKLQTLNASELSVIADSSGAFTFTSLSPGNYTVVVIAGDDYEIGRDAVYIDSDLDLSE